MYHKTSRLSQFLRLPLQFFRLLWPFIALYLFTIAFVCRFKPALFYYQPLQNTRLIGCLVRRVRPGRVGVGRLLHDGGGDGEPGAVHVRSHLLASRHEQVGALSLHHYTVGR